MTEQPAFKSRDPHRIEMGRQYRTRSGKPVRIFMVGAGSLFPVIAAFEVSPGVWRADNWTSEGRAGGGGSNPLDLIEVKPEHTVWVNAYEFGQISFGHGTREEADAVASATRTACFAVTFREGEGLDI